MLSRLPTVTCCRRGSGLLGRSLFSRPAMGCSTLSMTPLAMAMPTSAEITDLEADLMLLGVVVRCPAVPALGKDLTTLGDDQG